MDGGSHPSVEGITQAVQTKGGTLACLVCGREEFTLVEVTVLGSGMAEQYGTRRQQRAQMVRELRIRDELRPRQAAGHGRGVLAAKRRA